MSACSNNQEETSSNDDPKQKEKVQDQESEFQTGDYLQLKGKAQGTTYNIKYQSNETGVLKDAIDSLLLDFDNSVSTYNPSSLISEFNANGVVQLNDHFSQLFIQSQEVYHITEGIFNPAIYGLLELWGIERDDSDLVSDEDVQRVLASCQLEDIRFSQDSTQLISEREGMLEFNAIAQGYSVDLIAQFLESKGIHNYLVELGGEIYAKGNSVDDAPWKVGIELPNEDKTEIGEPVSASVELNKKGLATSGSYRKYKIVDGKRLSHTLNPETGYPSSNNLLSVTVIMDNAAMADAYATAFMVMGVEGSLDFIKNHPELSIEAYFIYDEEGQLKSISTQGLDLLQENTPEVL